MLERPLLTYMSLTLFDKKECNIINSTYLHPLLFQEVLNVTAIVLRQLNEVSSYEKNRFGCTDRFLGHYSKIGQST